MRVLTSCLRRRLRPRIPIKNWRARGTRRKWRELSELGTERFFNRKKWQQFQDPAGSKNISQDPAVWHISQHFSLRNVGFQPSPDLVGISRLPMPSCHLWRMCHWRTLSGPQVTRSKRCGGVFWMSTASNFFLGDLWSPQKLKKKNSGKNWGLETTLYCIFFGFRFAFANAYLYNDLSASLLPQRFFCGKGGYLPTLWPDRYAARVLHDRESLEKRCRVEGFWWMDTPKMMGLES